MLTMIFALFYIFTSLRVSSSTVDGQGLITVAVRIHLFDGMSRWASGVLASAASARSFSWRLSRSYEKSKGTATNNGNSNNKRKEMEKIRTP